MTALSSRLAGGGSGDSHETRNALCIIATTLVMAATITTLVILNLFICMDNAEKTHALNARIQDAELAPVNVSVYNATAIVSLHNASCLLCVYCF